LVRLRPRPWSGTLNPPIASLLRKTVNCCHHLLPSCPT